MVVLPIPTILNGSPATPGHQPDKALLQAYFLQLEAMAGAGAIKGFSASVAALPSSGNTSGDYRLVLDSDVDVMGVYLWGGSSWARVAPLPSVFVTDLAAALAEGYRDEAEGFKISAAASSAAAGVASGRFVITEFSELASKFVAESPADGQVILPVGGIVVDEKTGNRWERVTTGATLDYTGSSGVKFLVLARGGTYHGTAVGIAAGATDHSTALTALATTAAGAPIMLAPGEYNFASGDFSAVNLVCQGSAYDSGNSTVYIHNVALIRSAVAMTVGATGDVATLAEALRRAEPLTFANSGSLTISLQAQTHTYSETTANWNFQDPPRISIVGATPPGIAPAVADLSTTRATGVATALARYASIIEIDTSLGTSGGLFFPRGINKIKDVCINNLGVRYSLFSGVFTGSFTGIFGPMGSMTLDGCTVIGGTWGAQTVNGALLLVNKNAFIYQETISGNQAGGGLRAQGAAAFLHNGESPSSYSTVIYQIGNGATAAQVGVQIQAGEGRLGSGTLDIRGCRTPLLANRGGVLNATTARIADSEFVAAARSGGRIIMSNSAISGADAFLANAGEQVIDGRTMAYRPLISAGGTGSEIIADALTIDGCEAAMCYYAVYGGTIMGTTNAIDDCKWYGGVDAVRRGVAVADGGNIFLRAVLTNPRASSTDVSRARRGGLLEHDGSTGMTFDPTATTAPSVIWS